MPVVGVGIIVVGVLFLLIGGGATKRAVRREYGSISQETMMMAQGTGLNPWYAPYLVVGGWLLVLVGVVVGVVILIAG